MKQGYHHTAEKEFDIDVATVEFSPAPILQSQRSDLNYLNFTLNQNNHTISSTQKCHPLQTESNIYYDKNVILHKKLKTLEHNVNIWTQKIKLKDSQIVNYTQAIKKKRQMKKLYEAQLKRSKVKELQLQEKHNWAINKVEAKKQELSYEQQLIQQQIQQIKQIINKISQLEKQYIRTEKQIKSTSEKYQLKQQLKNNQKKQKEKITQLRIAIQNEKKKQKSHENSMDELSKNVNLQIRKVNFQLQTNNKLKQKLSTLANLNKIQNEDKIQKQLQEKNQFIRKMQVQIGFYYEKLVNTTQRCSEIEMIVMKKNAKLQQLRQQLFQLKKRSSPVRKSLKANIRKPFQLHAPPTPKKNYILSKPLKNIDIQNGSRQSFGFTQQNKSVSPQYADLRFDTFNNFYFNKQETKRPTPEQLSYDNISQNQNASLYAPCSQKYNNNRQQYAERRFYQSGDNQMHIQNRQSYQYQIIESDSEDNNGQQKAVLYPKAVHTQRINNKVRNKSPSQNQKYNETFDNRKFDEIRSGRKQYDQSEQFRSNEVKPIQTKISKNSSLQLKQLIDRYYNYKKYSILESN